MKGGCKDPFRSKNRVIEEQKTKKQEAQNVAISYVKGLPLSFLALFSTPRRLQPVLWRSDIYEILPSRPISPLIVQESARLSPNDIEIIIILCKKKKLRVFPKDCPGTTFSADEYP